MPNAMTRLARAVLSMVFLMVASLHGLPAQAQTSGASPAAAPSTATGSRAEPARASGGATADPHRQQDITRHRAMATAHETAARCLEAGERESVCQERLRKACEGMAIGRYCGMKHAH